MEKTAYALAGKLKLKGKLVADIVGHMSREISRAAWFLECGGKTNGKIFEEKYIPSSVPKGGLEIMLSTKSNYLENADVSSYEINDLAMINV